MAVRRCAVARSSQFRSVQTVPKIGTEAEMQAEAIEQVRARIAYQKEVMAANPHKSHDEEWNELEVASEHELRLLQSCCEPLRNSTKQVAKLLRYRCETGIARLSRSSGDAVTKASRSRC